MNTGLAIVTGASGHLGNVLVRALLERGVPVRAVVQPEDDLVALSGLDVERVEADVRAPSTLVTAFQGGDVVYHFAGIVSITLGDEARMQRVNVGGTRHVLQACRAQGIRRLVHVGSVHALVEPASGVIDETAGFDPARAGGPYARTKAQACLDVQAAAKAGEVDAVLVLPTAVVGPWDFRLSEMGQLITNLGDGCVPFLVEGAYDFVDVRDVAQGTLAAAERGRTGEAYLLGGEQLDLRHLALAIAKASGRRPPRVLPHWLSRLVAAPAPLYERFTHRRALLTPYALRTLGAPFTVSHQKAARELAFRPRPAVEAVVDAWRWQLRDPQSPRNRRLRTPGPGRLIVQEAA